MTHDDWKKLVKEYKMTDSLKKRKKLKKSASTVACALCKVLEELYFKWGEEILLDPDYEFGRGHRILHDFDEDTAWITCTNVVEFIEIPMKYLDEDCLKQKNAELRDSCMKNLTEQLDCKLLCIENMKKQCDEIREKLVELEKERKQI